MLDEWIEKRLDEVLRGKLLNEEEALRFMEFEPDSFEAACTINAAMIISRKASKNIGQVYAQIGLDKLPCPANCDFCKFAAKQNTYSKNEQIVPLEDVVRFAQAFDKGGAHLISLMSTAAYPFDQFCEVVQEVRENISDNMPVMANIGDITLEQAQKLKKLGVQSIYHAHRLQEGTITSINPQSRIATLDAAVSAGLQIMTSVEPVQASSNPEEIVQRMFEVIAYKPYCSGIGKLTPARGTAMENTETISGARGKQLACIMRLCAGESIPFGTGAGNVLWADAGTSPRGKRPSEDFDILAYEVLHKIRTLKGEDWDVPRYPLKMLFD